jgi:hypothetical protein
MKTENVGAPSTFTRQCFGPVGLVCIASPGQRQNPVTSVCQYLFLGFQVGHKIRNPINTMATEQREVHMAQWVQASSSIS